jgi:hypothetical protein
MAPEQIAGELERQFGTRVNPADIAAANRGWWNLGSSGGTAARWTPEERELFAGLYREGVPYAGIADRIREFSGRELAPNSINTRARNFGLAARSNVQDLWPREANLALAQMAARGMLARDIAGEISNQFGRAYTGEQIAQQMQRLRIGSRSTGGGTPESWQPDALELLKSGAASGMSPAELADAIQRETGQVVTRNAVIGKLDRLRDERARSGPRSRRRW